MDCKAAISGFTACRLLLSRKRNIMGQKNSIMEATNRKSKGISLFLAGLINFCGLSNIPLRIKNFMCFLKKLGAWEHGHHIIADGISYKYDSVSRQYVPYNPNEEQDVYSKQLFEKRNRYRNSTKAFFKNCFPYFVAIMSICFNVAQCVAE